MIKVEHLVKSFYDKTVLKDISFEVKDGETLAIVGFSGSGKSTILKIIWDFWRLIQELFKHQKATLQWYSNIQHFSIH